MLKLKFSHFVVEKYGIMNNESENPYVLGNAGSDPHKTNTDPQPFPFLTCHNWIKSREASGGTGEHYLGSTFTWKEAM